MRVKTSLKFSSYQFDSSRKDYTKVLEEWILSPWVMTTDLHLFEPLEHILQGRVVLQSDGLALGSLHHLEILHLGSSVSYDVIQNHLCQNVSISLNLGTQRDLYPVLYIFWVCCTFLRKQTKQHLHLKDAVPRSKSKLHF